MNEERPEGIERYDEPAGGWGALRAVAAALKQQQAVERGTQALWKQNKPDGFDCPSCAWPDPDHTAAFEFCENGAKAVAWESTSRRVTPEFFAQHSVSQLWQQSDHWLEDQGRITHPLRYNAATDHYEAVSWSEAMAAIGKGLAALDSPDHAEFYTSGRASNEAAFLYQLFVRLYGTNNFPDCSNMCHEATSVGLPKSIGVGKGTVSLEDFDHADLILSFGHNPGTNHPRMMATLRSAARRGARIIAFNPLRERALERFASPQSPVEMVTMSSTPISDTYLQVKVGGDAAAIKGLAKALLMMDAVALADGRPGVIDRDFIAEHTAGFEAFAKDAMEADWKLIEFDSGLSRLDLENVARIYAEADATILCYGMGVTQHTTGTQNVQQLTNLLLMKGNIGRKGAGICPVRGHSNVQGDRTVGIWERPTEAFLDRMQEVFNFDPPRKHGHSVVESIAAMREGISKAVVCLGGNLAIACSDPAACAEAFRKQDLAVHITTKLNRTHLLMAKDSFILPCLGRTDLDEQADGPQAVTVEDSMSMVHASRGFLKPPSDMVRSEPWIIAHIAKATLEAAGKAHIGGVDWEDLVSDYDKIRDLIEAIFPEFTDYNQGIRKPGGFPLVNAAGLRQWNTPDGKAQFITHASLDEDEVTDDPTVLRLATLRSHDQYNTTVYGLDDRYRSVFGRRDILFVNPNQLEKLGFKEGDVVDVHTALTHAAPGRVVRNLTLVSQSIPDGCCGAYYPETQPLVALEHHDPQSMTPGYKSIPVKLVLSEVRVPDDAEELMVRRDGVAGMA